MESLGWALAEMRCGSRVNWMNVRKYGSTLDERYSLWATSCHSSYELRATHFPVPGSWLSGLSDHREPKSSFAWLFDRLIRGIYHPSGLACLGLLLVVVGVRTGCGEWKGGALLSPWVSGEDLC